VPGYNTSYKKKWDNNIKMDLQEEGCGDMHVAQDRDRWRELVNAVMNFGTAEVAVNFLIN
jgi:hypothetical protein